MQSFVWIGGGWCVFVVMLGLFLRGARNGQQRQQPYPCVGRPGMAGGPAHSANAENAESAVNAPRRGPPTA